MSLWEAEQYTMVLHCRQRRSDALSPIMRLSSCFNEFMSIVVPVSVAHRKSRFLPKFGGIALDKTGIIDYNVNKFVVFSSFSPEIECADH